MFDIDINEDNSSIKIKENDSTIVAQGRFAVDIPDYMVLIQIISITISTDDDQQIHNLLTVLDERFGKTYQARVIVRFPSSFDNKIDRNKPELKTNVSTFMTVNLSDLKYDNDYLIEYDREQYALITDKQAIVVYAKQIMIIMTTEAFWAKQWNEQEAHDRILSASAVAMIFDKVNQIPVGFGRIFIMRNNIGNEEQILGYLSDVAVTLQHQGKSLGKVIVNYLVGTYIRQDASQQQATGSLGLVCANRGSGAISALKMYRNLGFEHLDKIGNRIAIFPSDKYYLRRSVQLQFFHQN